MKKNKNKEKNTKLSKNINLEQSLFIDLRKNEKINYEMKSQFSSQNLPENQDTIQYTIFKDFLKIDEKKFEVKQKKDQQIIYRIIKELRNQIRLGMSIQTSKQFKNIALQNATLILEHMKNQDPQCALISLRLSTIDARFQIKIQKLIEIADKSKYPLLITQLFIVLFMKSLNQSSNKKFLQKSLDYLQFGKKYGVQEAFLWYGFYYTKLGQGKKAYQMLKNGQKYGFQPVASKYLGQLFMGDVFDIPKNFIIAQKYFKKAKQLGAQMDNRTLNHLKVIEEQKNKSLKITQSIKSNQDTRALQLSNFIHNKMREKQFLQHKYGFGMTSNQCSEESFSNICPPKTFYVVFSPLMGFPGRHFLVKDQNQNIQYVSLYGWQIVPIAKLKLLHEVGTKIILNSYIRKLGANDQLPMYRVQDPNSVEFYPRTEKHSISDQQFREHAKNLFQRNLLDKAMTVYEYMVMKNASQLQIVYSNMGLISQRRNNMPEAIKYYQMSLKIKKYQKSQIRLANIFISNNQYLKAETLAQEIQNQNERNQLINKIQSLKLKSKQISDFTKTVRNKYRLEKKIMVFSLLQFLGNNPNPSCSINIREDKQFLLYFRNKFEQSFGERFKSQEQFLDNLQKIYKSVDDINLNKQMIRKFYQMTSTVYEIRFGKNLYPYSVPYSFIVKREISPINSLEGHQNLKIGSQTVFYMSSRQNYLENRIQDICLELEQKNKYRQAQDFYRLTGNNCSPFMVKIAQLLLAQLKFTQCVKYCQQSILYMMKYQIQNFFKYICQLIVERAKALIKLNKYQQAYESTQKYLQQINKINPKYVYQNYSSKDYLKLFFGEKKTNFQNGIQFIRNISKQITRACIYLKKYQKAKQYLCKTLVQKQLCNYSQIIDFYYQTKLLQIMIIKQQNPKQTVIKINFLLNQINKDKKLDNKPSFIKFLMKQKLSLQINAANISQTILLCQQIVKINNVNLIFVKQKCLGFIKGKLDQAVQILTKINQSQVLKCLSDQIAEIIYHFLESNKQKIAKNQNNYPQIKEIQQYLRKILESQQQIKKVLQQEQAEQDKSSISQDQNQLTPQSSFTTEKSQFDERIQDFEEQQADEYQYQICRFKGKNNIIYIVIFDEKLIQSLEISEYRKFVCAADHICRRQYGSTGIKIKNQELRLKINWTARLIGKIIQSKQNSKIRICYFNKRQNHDDYKRKSKK